MIASRAWGTRLGAIQLNHGDQRAVEFDGVLDDDEAVFGVLEDGDEEAAGETDDEDVGAS